MPIFQNITNFEYEIYKPKVDALINKLGFYKEDGTKAISRIIMNTLEL